LCSRILAAFFIILQAENANVHRNCVYNRFCALQFFAKNLLFVIFVHAGSCYLYMYINIYIVYLTTLSVDFVPSNEKLTNEV